MASSIPNVVADFETALNVAVSQGDTTASLVSIVDTDGNNLANGYYGFTIDNDTDYKEFILCTLTGTALTSIFSVSDQGVATSGFANYHRRGASVQITDHASLLKVVQTLTGQIGIDGGNPLYYDVAPSLGSGLQLATVQYVLDTVNGGPVSFNATTIAGDAGENVADGDWVYQLTSDGEWYLTDADVIAKSLGVRIGKARGAGTNGNAIAGGVFIGGLETVGTYTPGQAYYLSNTAGALSTSAGTNSVLVGYGDANGDLLLRQVLQSAVDASDGSLGIPSAGNKFITQENTTTTLYDQTQTTQNATETFGAADTAGNRNKLAQSFVAGHIKIRGVQLYKSANTGSFTGTVTIALQADSAGSPSGVNLASVTLTNAQYLALPTGQFSANFSSEYSMTIGTTYWIVLSSSTADNANKPNLGTNSAGGYANGVLKYNNTADGWVALSADLYFRTVVGIVGQVPYVDTDRNALLDATNRMLLADITAGTLVEATTSETTSYSGTVDTSLLAIPGRGLRITSTFRMRSVTGTPNPDYNMIFRLKIGGVTIVNENWTFPDSNTWDEPLLLQLRVFTTAAGIQSYSYFITAGSEGVSASSLVLNNKRASGAISSPATPASGTAITTTFQPNTSDGDLEGQTLDMFVEAL